MFVIRNSIFLKWTWTGILVQHQKQQKVRSQWQCQDQPRFLLTIGLLLKPIWNKASQWIYFTLALLWTRITFPQKLIYYYFRYSILPSHHGRGWWLQYSLNQSMNGMVLYCNTLDIYRIIIYSFKCSHKVQLDFLCVCWGYIILSQCLLKRSNKFKKEKKKYIYLQKHLLSNLIFGMQPYFNPTRWFMDPKQNLTLIFFDPNFFDPKFFWPKFFLEQIRICPTQISDLNFLHLKKIRTNIFLTHKFFWPTLF